MKNNGNILQYYVEGHHEPIIDPDTFDLVQAEMKKRIEKRHRFTGDLVFSSKLVCAECGAFFGTRTWHSTDKYRRTVWMCSARYRRTRCKTPTLYLRHIHEIFVKAINKLLKDKKDTAIIRDIKVLPETVADKLMLLM